MKRVVELRVHGVGGTPPEHLLGVPSDEIVRVGGEDESAFWARRDDGAVEGYSWGALTSKPLMQPLWIFLLPFTLMNVAGWMLPRPSRRFWWQVARVLFALLGLSLTISYVFGLSSIIIKQVFVQSGLLGWIENEKTALLAGTGTMVVLGLVTGWVAGITQRRFEMVESRTDSGGDRSSERSDSYPRALLTQSGDLGDSSFWSNRRAARGLLWLHALVALVALAVYVGRAWTELDPNTMELGVGPLFTYLGLAQFGLVALLIFACLFGFPLRTFFSGNFRVLGPVVAISTAFGLAGGFLAGLSIVVGKALGHVGEFSEDVVVGGPELKMNLAFGFGMLTFLLVFLGFTGLVWFRWRRSELRKIRESNVPPMNTVPPAEPPNGIPRTMVGQLANARAFAGGLRHIDLLLTIPAVPFAVVAFILLVNLLRGDQMDWAMFAWVPDLGWLDAGWFWDAMKPGYLSDAGGWVAALAVAFVLVRLRRDYQDPEKRRFEGILWDVLTFWPRRFHPLAVRPYAERAVPELETRLRYHLRQGETRVLLSAHSQGTILAFAALSQILAADEELPKRVSLLTYGSPLDRLHARFFPGYFDAAGFSNLEKSLFQGEVLLDGRTVPAAASWFNFFKETDYIGQGVPIGSPDRHNEIIADPPETPSMPYPPGSFSGPPDEPLPAWVQLAMHSHYNRHPRVKEWVRKAKSLLSK